MIALMLLEREEEDDEPEAEAEAPEPPAAPPPAPDEDDEPDDSEAPTFAPSSSEMPEHLLNPPGLVGRIAKHITDSARYPQHPLSIGAALVVVGTVAGRKIAGPTKSGTHLYGLGLAPSGAGKEHPRSMIETLLETTGLAHLIGPGQFISGPAVCNFLARQPQSVCAMDEFGSFLKRVNSKRASGFEQQVTALMRMVWGCSFRPWQSPEWAGRTKITVYGPAMSVFGVSTLEEFYQAVHGADIHNGILNRFFCIITKMRPDERTPLVNADEVPEEIIAKLQKIYGPIGNMDGVVAAAEKAVPPYEMLDITPEADQVRKAMIRELKAMEIADKYLEPFLARTAEMAIRIATILAIGQGLTVVEQSDMEWGRDFMMWSVLRMAEEARLHIFDSDTQEIANAIRRALKGKGRVPRWKLTKALDYNFKARDYESVLDQMVLARDVKADPNKTKGRSGVLYTLREAKKKGGK
jgi:hypothetical protein